MLRRPHRFRSRALTPSRNSPSFGISPKFFVGCSKSIARGCESWYSYISNDTFFCQYSLKRTIF